VTSLAFVTHQTLALTGGTPASDLASVRREVILPALALRARGYEAGVISLRGLTSAHLRDVLGDARHVVFGKIFPNPGAAGAVSFASDADAYSKALSFLRQDQSAWLCVSDDHFDHAEFAAFYRSAAPRARGWIAPSPAIRDRLKQLLGCDAAIFPEPVEMPAGVPHVPRRGLRERIGSVVARHAKIGLEPWRVHLLWFGHPSNAAALLAALVELESLAREVPLHLECVTQPASELVAKITPRGQGFSAPLRISLTPWSLEATRAALERCDAVILPQLTDDPRKRAKSNNRLVDSLHAGRFVIAHPIPAYEELRQYAWIGDSIEDGLRWLLRHPGEALQRVRAGQEYVTKHHSIEALGEFWMKTLGLAHGEPFFVVYAKDWLQRSAGRRALHLLAHFLNERGAQAYVSACSVVNPKLHTPIIDAAGIARLRGAGRPCVAIYPEVIHDDPFQADVAVRWMLNKPGLFRPGFRGQYGESDLHFYWDPEYQTLPVEAWPLKLPHIDRTIFNNENNPLDASRKGRVLFARKYLDAGHRIEPELLDGTIDISLRPPEYRSIPPQELASIFRAARYLITYEPSSVTMEAQLCGCPVVYRLSNYMRQPPRILGGAGATTTSLAEEDIAQARATLPRVQRAYAEGWSAANEQIDFLIARCRERLATWNKQGAGPFGTAP
jgi:glycosyltransferase involved in cell wall biosynthesis